MAQSGIHSAFLNTLAERYKKFCEQFHVFLATLAGENAADKQPQAKALIASLSHLDAIVPPDYKPEWMRLLNNALIAYASTSIHEQSRLAIQKTIGELYSDINTQEWDFNEDDPAPVAANFDVIYREEFDRSQLPALFDRIIGVLNSIAESGAVDSILFMQALDKIIATLKANARGSYSATEASRKIAKRFVRHYLVGLTKMVPVVKQAVEAMEKTFAEMDVEIDIVKRDVTRRFGESLPSSLPSLPGLGAAPMALEYFLDDELPDRTPETQQAPTP